MIVILINFITTILLSIYIASGDYVLFQKKGFKNLICHFGATQRCETMSEHSSDENACFEKVEYRIPENKNDDGFEIEFKIRNLRDSIDIFLHQKKLWFFAIITFLVTTGFYCFREYYVVVAPLLNLKYTILLFLFIAVAVVDAHYSIIPNHLVIVGLAYWVSLVAFSYLVERQELMNVFKFSLVGALFGGGVLFLCRTLMKNSMGYGDVKFLAVVGLICGFFKTFNILFYSLFIIFFIGIFLLVTKKADRHAKLPMGPFFLLGYLIAGIVGV